MGITLRQPGEAVATARAGGIIGKAQRAEEERAKAEREQIQQAEAKTRLKAQQMAMDWDLQKMQINSQRAFERELRQEDYRLSAEDRSAAWQIEKMEIASRMDFEMDEKERITKMERLRTKKLAIEKDLEAGKIDRNWETDSMLWNIEQQLNEVKNPRPLIDPQKRLLYNMQREAVQRAAGVSGPTTGPVTVQQVEALAATGRTYLRQKSDGTLVEIPIENVKKAISTGRFEYPDIEGGAAPTTVSTIKKVLTYKPFADRQAGTARFDFAERYEAEKKRRRGR